MRSPKLTPARVRELAPRMYDLLRSLAGLDLDEDVRAEFLEQIEHDEFQWDLVREIEEMLKLPKKKAPRKK